METLYVWILIAGFGGGMVRGLVGFIKHQFSFSKVGFNSPYFFGMMFLSGIVGVLTAAAVYGAGLPAFGGIITPGFAFIIGYAGGDFIENLYKIIMRKPSIY